MARSGHEVLLQAEGWQSPSTPEDASKLEIVTEREREMRRHGWASSRPATVSTADAVVTGIVGAAAAGLLPTIEAIEGSGKGHCIGEYKGKNVDISRGAR